MTATQHETPATATAAPVIAIRSKAKRAPAAPASLKKPAATLPADLADLSRLTIKDVCSLVGRSESSVRELIRAGRFPAPDYRDGPRCVRWSARLVRNWLAATTSGQGVAA